MKEIREEFEWIKFIRETYAEMHKKNVDPKTADTFGKTIRRSRARIKQLYKRHPDPLRPLMTNWREHDWHVRYDEENWDSWTEYALFPDNGETEEELREIERDLTVTIHSAYDCTGKPFTNWVDAKRCPAGIIVIRSWSLDV